MLRKSLFSALSLLLVACTETPVAPTRMDIQFSADVKPSKALATKIDTDIEAAIADEQMVGLGVAVVFNKHLVFARGYGFADLDKKLGVGSSTRFNAAPLSPAIGAVLALALADAGKLDLDAPIQRYEPAFPEKDPPVTARKLLATPDDHQWWGAIEPAGGMSFEKLAEELVFKPGGMKNTQIEDEAKPVDKAVGYERSKSGVVYKAAPLDYFPTSTADRLVSTPSDLAHFAIALMQGKILSPDMRDKMWTSQKTGDGELTHYGLGATLGSWKGQLVVSGGGTQEGVTSSLWIAPERGCAVALIANTGHVKLEPLTHQLADDVCK